MYKSISCCNVTQLNMFFVCLDTQPYDCFNIFKRNIWIFCVGKSENQVFKICTGINDKILIWERLQENLDTNESEYCLKIFGKIEAMMRFFLIFISSLISSLIKDMNQYVTGCKFAVGKKTSILRDETQAF